MSALVEQLRGLWNERAPREQILLAALGAIVLGIALWYGVLSAAIEFRDGQRRAYIAAAERYRVIESGIERYQAAQQAGTQSASDTRPVRTIVTESAFAAGIPLARLTPGEDGRIDVWIETVPAADLLRWLDNLQTRAGIYVVRASLDRESSGLVSAQLVLQGAG